MLKSPLLTDDENWLLEARYQDYRRAHPDATPKDFLLAAIAEATDIPVDQWVADPPDEPC